jgi:hypothetical protein
MNEVRGIAKETLPFVQGLVHQAVIVLLQVPEAAVHELRRSRGSPGREVLSFDQCSPQPTGCRIERYAAPGDPAPDDEQVELVSGEPLQGVPAVEKRGGHSGSALQATQR